MTHTPQTCHSDSDPLRSPGGRRQQIVYRQVKDLKINPKNPRAHSKKQIRQLAESIRAFGFNGAIIVDRDLNIIAGHARLQGCKLLGFTDVPTIMAEHLGLRYGHAVHRFSLSSFAIAAWNSAPTTRYEDFLW